MIVFTVLKHNVLNMLQPMKNSAFSSRSISNLRQIKSYLFCYGHKQVKFYSVYLKSLTMLDHFGRKVQFQQDLRAV